jgi:hypothetical protein
MVRAKAKRRRWKRYLVLFSILCGSLYFAELRYGFFRLRDLEITAGAVIPEEVIWQALPKKTERFWLSLLFGNGIFEKRVTNYFPVSIKTRIVGWGRYRVTVKPLDIFLCVSWNSKQWWLSEDGRMWQSALPAGALVNGINYPSRPILSWDSELPIPIDPEKQAGDIYPSSLPLVKIKKWYETIGKMNWKEDIYCLMAKKIDGRQVVQIVLGTEGRATGEIVVKEDASDWLSLAAALESIYPSASGGVPQGVSINATYTDMKFTVSDKR